MMLKAGVQGEINDAFFFFFFRCKGTSSVFFGVEGADDGCRARTTWPRLLVLSSAAPRSTREWEDRAFCFVFCWRTVGEKERGWTKRGSVYIARRSVGEGGARALWHVTHALRPRVVEAGCIEGGEASRQADALLCKMGANVVPIPPVVAVL